MNFLINNLNKTEKICHILQIGCPNIIPGLRAQPFWNPLEFNWVHEIEESYPIILQEFLEMKEKGQLFQVLFPFQFLNIFSKFNFYFLFQL